MYQNSKNTLVNFIFSSYSLQDNLHFSPQILLVTISVYRVTALLWFVNISYVDLVISQQLTLSFVLLPTILVIFVFR